ncbi:MAG: VanZ family protein [Defluviitaleaceae bacterium]|nr:VanZ family protein [Defluviitaleaceae bacterium]
MNTKKNPINPKKIKVLYPILTVFIAVGIFISSALHGDMSGSASTTVVDFVRHFVPFPLSDEVVLVVHFFLRKAAHFFVYFLLAFCTAQSLRGALPLSSDPVDVLRTQNINGLVGISSRSLNSVVKKYIPLLAWAFASFYGITDEIHQHFVPGRVMSFTDVLIDSAGALAGVGVFYLWARFTNSPNTAQ